MLANGNDSGFPRRTDSPTWAFASPASEDLSGDSDTIRQRQVGEVLAALDRDLAEQFSSAEELARLRFWVDTVECDWRAILRDEWLALFPNPDRRPTVSFVQNSLPAGVCVQAEGVAVNGDRRSLYCRDRSDHTWPDGCVAGDLVFLGAVEGSDIEGGGVPADPAAQARHVFERFDDLMSQAGLEPESFGHMLVWYAEHSIRDLLNPPFVDRFPTNGERPARHSVKRTLPAGQAVQAEATLVRGGQRICYMLSGIWHGGIQNLPNSLPFGTRLGRYLFSAATYGREMYATAGGDMDSQSAWALQHTARLLAAGGLSPSDVGHAFVWLGVNADRSVFDRHWTRMFPDPARAPVRVDVVSELPADFLVQVEVTARAAP